MSTAPTRTPPLVVENATRLFDGTKGLNDVSLTLRAGEIYGLLGPNGAGKTSLIRAVCGRLRLTGGTVLLEGRSPASGGTARTGLGLVPQQIALHQDLTVRENLQLLGRLAGVAAGEVKARVGWGLGWADLEARADDLVKTLSGGMQRRLNLVAGVLHRPTLLLLDEPTVGIDPDARLRVHALLETLRSEGMTLLLTTHDLDEATTLSDRIGFLVDGRLRAEGTLEDLLRQTLQGAQHLEVLLDRRPDESAQSVLAGLGLQPSRDPARWLGTRSEGLGTLARIENALAAAGLGVRQVTLVEPGLREVFLHVTGRELEQ
jgi:ABC-2 type transport system ATP-binding protein